MVKIKIDTLSQLPAAAQELLRLFGAEKVVAFEGEMGSGKTTIIKALCDCLGVKDNVSSPTFSIVNEYFTENGETIYHFDFYRLKSLREALDIGVEEYFYSGAYCFIEWPEKIGELLPETALRVFIEKENDASEQRIVIVGA